LINGNRAAWARILPFLTYMALLAIASRSRQEELFWRSFLMRWIDTPAFESVEPSQVSIKSLILTSVLFGFEHNL
jgi:hypothetical protein